jgi:hypothetical protein
VPRVRVSVRRAGDQFTASRMGAAGGKTGGAGGKTTARDTAKTASVRAATTEGPCAVGFFRAGVFRRPEDLPRPDGLARPDGFRGADGFRRAEGFRRRAGAGLSGGDVSPEDAWLPDDAWLSAGLSSRPSDHPRRTSLFCSASMRVPFRSRRWAGSGPETLFRQNRRDPDCQGLPA